MVAMSSKQKPIVSKKLRDSARNQPCLVRLPGICNFNQETTVLAHLNGGGTGAKKSDLTAAAFACSSCHDELDRRTRHMDADLVELEHRRGVERTQEYWVQNGFIKVI
jgi:hypothetical protein